MARNGKCSLMTAFQCIPALSFDIPLKIGIAHFRSKMWNLDTAFGDLPCKPQISASISGSSAADSVWVERLVYAPRGGGPARGTLKNTTEHNETRTLKQAAVGCQTKEAKLKKGPKL